jgi:hypothetical protein
VDITVFWQQSDGQGERTAGLSVPVGATREDTAAAVVEAIEAHVRQAAESQGAAVIGTIRWKADSGGIGGMMKL